MQTTTTRYDSRLTPAEYRGNPEPSGRPMAIAAECRLANEAASLAGEIATAVQARLNADTYRFAETGRLDWGNVGDMQVVLARLIAAARALGFDGLPPEDV